MRSLLPPANEVWGKVMFYIHLWFCSQKGGLPDKLPWTETPWTETPWEETSWTEAALWTETPSMVKSGRVGAAYYGESWIRPCHCKINIQSSIRFLYFQDLRNRIDDQMLMIQQLKQENVVCMIWISPISMKKQPWSKEEEIHKSAKMRCAVVVFTSRSNLMFLVRCKT